MLKPVETTVDNDTLVVRSTELGDYCVIDMDKWFNELGVKPEKKDSQSLQAKNFYAIKSN